MKNEDPTIKKFLVKQKWNYTLEGDQYKIEKCPYCGDRHYHFYMSRVTGQCRCVKCDSSGNLYVLKKHLGIITPVTEVFPERKLSNRRITKYTRRCKKYHKALVKNIETRRYLYNKWEYTLKTIKKFKLGTVVRGGLIWLSIPYFNAENRISNVKFRTILTEKKNFARVKNMESSLFNVNNLNTTVNYVFLCEGESDTITAYTKFRCNVLGVSVGAGGFKESWKDVIDNFEVVYIIYDSDVVGQNGALKLAEKLGIHRCFNVVLPKGSKDLTEFWKNFQSKSYFDVIKERAKKFDVKDVVTIKDALTTLKLNLLNDDTLDAGLTTPFEKVNKLMGNLVPGDLITLSGQAKVGKTTLALNIGLYNALTHKIPVLNVCLEMRPERTVTKIISFLRLIEKNNIKQRDIDLVASKFKDKPFYLAHFYSFDQDLVFETIKSAVQRYNIQLLIFDHLHYLIRSTSNVVAEVSNTVRKFKLLAEEFKIPIILISQPRKLSGKSSRMTVDDLRDSSSIGQDSDTVLIVHRERLPAKSSSKTAIFSNATEIRIEASRYSSGGVTNLQFNGAFSRYFADIKEERKILTRRSSHKNKNMVYVF